MKRFAANRIMLDSSTVLLNAVVEVDDNGVVTRIFELSTCTSEPSSTLFFNGTISSYVPTQKIAVGRKLPELVAESLSVGYSGKLLLWQHLALSSFKITVETEVKEL